jgi:hypothetical protein
VGLSDNFVYITALACILLPLSTWVALRHWKHWKHTRLSWLALASFWVTFFLFEAIYSHFLKSDCNDCEQAQGFATVILITPVFALWLAMVIVTSIYWLTVGRRTGKTK